MASRQAYVRMLSERSANAPKMMFRTRSEFEHLEDPSQRCSCKQLIPKAAFHDVGYSQIPRNHVDALCYVETVFNHAEEKQVFRRVFVVLKIIHRAYRMRARVQVHQRSIAVELNRDWMRSTHII
jgi:hypothetical protein